MLSCKKIFAPLQAALLTSARSAKIYAVNLNLTQQFRIYEMMK